MKMKAYLISIYDSYLKNTVIWSRLLIDVDVGGVANFDRFVKIEELTESTRIKSCKKLTVELFFLISQYYCDTFMLWIGSNQQNSV